MLLNGYLLILLFDYFTFSFNKAGVIFTEIKKKQMFIDLAEKKNNKKKNY